MTKRTLFIALAVLAAGYVLTTLIPDVTEPDAGDGRLIQKPCWFVLEAPWGAEWAPKWGTECYQFSVPENRLDSETRRISMPVVVLRSPEGARDKAPVLHIQGGPGQPVGMTDAAQMQGWADYLRVVSWAKGRDHILFDPRGVGALSDPHLRCALLSDINWGAHLDALGEGSPAWKEAVTEGITFCRDGLAKGGVDFTVYGTPEVAADLVALRKALKIGQWVPYGISYGTRSALELMRIDGDAVVAAILDSATPSHVPAYVDLVPLLDQRLNELFDRCARDDTCRTAFPDLPGSLAAALARLDEDPVPVTLRDPAGNRTVSMTFKGVHLLYVLEYGLTTDGWAGTIPLLIDSTAKGDLTLLEWQASVIAFDPYLQTDANVLSYLTQCRDELPFNDPGDWAAGRAAAPLLAPIDFEESFRFACDLWPVGVAPAHLAVPVESDAPVLLINGSLDPRTPREWAEDQARFLPNSHVVVIKGASHAPSVLNACAVQAMAAFLEAPEDFTPPVCLAQDHPVPFTLTVDGSDTPAVE